MVSACVLRGIRTCLVGRLQQVVLLYVAYPRLSILWKIEEAGKKRSYVYVLVQYQSYHAAAVEMADGFI